TFHSGSMETEEVEEQNNVGSPSPLFERARLFSENKNHSKQPITPICNGKSWEVQFGDKHSQFQVTIHNAREFRELRSNVLPRGDASFIKSLARCHNWNACGGKSGSFFLRTRDERFVIKEFSNTELKTFLAKANRYFKYMAETLKKKRPTVLARILGVYRVECKNLLTGCSSKSDVLVMENLFHNQPNIKHIYDLKGSRRKRFVSEQQAPSQTDLTELANDALNMQNVAEDEVVELLNDSPRMQVLLDQNFANSMLDSPIFMRASVKSELNAVLTADTDFLVSLLIMDYSLLVGVDQKNCTLVIGIIDYVREFTMDKKVEMIFKQTIAGTSQDQPTVVTPRLYRDRFLSRLNDYFTVVSDHWSHSHLESFKEEQNT
ncbi:hypothetical protein Ciccas_011854, partial [Cichlidogyrus casuarinus]